MAFEFIKSIFGSGNGSGGELLLPADQFRTLILRECARCDRNSHAFSLIHIDLRGDGQDNSLARSQRLRQLSRSIVRRMRTTDELGWMDGHSVGVFLPETGMEGTRSLARDTCQGFAYQIYTYPWLGNIREDVTGSGNLRDFDSSSGFHGSPRDDMDRQMALLSEDIESRGQKITPLLKTVPAGRDSGAAGKDPDRNTPQAACIEELLLPDHAPAWKRAYDILGSSFLLTVFSPVFAMVALYIKMVSPGPVFFRQERVGYLGRPFTMVKFRTMRAGSADNISVHRDYLKELINSGDKAMTKLDTGTDNRLIPLAGILRRGCIDELPQLINVLKGDMSLVGPRPCLDYEAREFALWQRRRFHTVPGMTGLWQVSGKNRLTFKEMMRLDVRYANRKNASMDLMISLKTVPAILGQVKDAVSSKLATAPSEPKVRISRKWSINDLIRQMFL